MGIEKIFARNGNLKIFAIFTVVPRERIYKGEIIFVLQKSSILMPKDLSAHESKKKEKNIYQI